VAIFAETKTNPTIMKCIFCKQNSENAKSVEHIIPESLGNKSHVLEKGIVCDKCNNYFATKIEKNVLEQSYFRSLRHRNDIVNKKNKLPKEFGFIAHPKGGKIEIINKYNNQIEINIDSQEIYNLIKEQKVDKLYFPILTEPEKDNIYLSKLLGKIALEALAQRVSTVENWNEDFIDHEGLDDLRNYVRFGKGKFWEYKQRKVYEENDGFKDISNPQKPDIYQTLHEYDFLYIDNKYLFFICIIMGIEYTINMVESTLELYNEWLIKNENKSHLERDYQIKK
jgi:hypothetical protein